MKKVEQISIAGFAFMIDADAHNLLSNYLRSLMKKYGTSKENDMVYDIESRIAEILQEKIGDSKGILNIEMIRAIMIQVGTISSIEMDSLDTESGVRFDFEQPTSDKYQMRDKLSRGGCKLLRFISACFTVGSIISIISIIIAIISLVIISENSDYLNGIEYKYVLYILMSTITLFLFFASFFSRGFDRGRRFFSKWITIVILFVLSLIVVPVSIYCGMKLNSGRNVESVISEVMYLEIDPTKPLYIAKYSDTDTSGLNRIIFMERDLDVEMDTEATSVRIVIEKSSYGSSVKNAERRANDLPTGIAIDGNTITIDKYLPLSLKESSYSPEIEIEIYYPSRVKVIRADY